MNINEIENKLGYQLSDEQKNVLNHNNGALAVVACAGSGKTTTIETKMIYDILNNRCKPNEILCITFSKVAQLDMLNRYDELYQLIAENNADSKPQFSTFHAYFRQLLINALGMIKPIVDPSEYAYDLQKVLDFKLNSGYDVSDGISTILNHRALLMNTMESLDGLMFVDSIPQGHIFDLKEYQLVVKEYIRLKKLNNQIDFDDLQVDLYQTLSTDDTLKNKLIKDYFQKLKYIYIDEYQDISLIQFEIMNLLFDGNFDRLCVIGDDDQSIYRFRGSSPEFILDFENMTNYAKILYLSTNYRCKDNILKHCKQLIESNYVRFDKNIQAFNNGGNIEFINKNVVLGFNDIMDKLDLIPRNESTAILCRNNLQLALSGDILSEEGYDIQFKNITNCLENRYEYREIIDVINAVKFNDTDAAIKIGHKLMIASSRVRVKNLVENAFKENKHWIDHAFDTDFYTQSSLTNLKLVKDEMQQTDDTATLIKLCSSILMPFYNELNRNSGSTKNEVYAIIFNYLIFKYENNKVTFDQFLRYSDKKIVYYEDNIRSQSGIKMSTFHGSKGLEFDNVIVCYTDKTITPDVNSLIITATINNDLKSAIEKYEEERRLFYVACTRAKNQLIIFYEDGKQSPFVKEMMHGDELTLLDAIGHSYADNIASSLITNIKLQQEVSDLLSPKIKSQLF